MRTFDDLLSMVLALGGPDARVEVKRRDQKTRLVILDVWVTPREYVESSVDECVQRACEYMLKASRDRLVELRNEVAVLDKATRNIEP